MTENIPDTIRHRIEAAQRRHQVPSLTVGVARAGKPLGLESVGFADVPDGRAACPSNQYRIGSITKTFTAAIVLLLAERELLDLDEPIDRYLPGTGVGRARLRQLLAHTGGVQREAPLPMWSTMRGPDREGLLQSLTRAETVARPGARWHYSNLGYAILGQIVQRVTGTPGEELITAELLAPLGLSSTTWWPEPDRVIGYRLDPYRPDVVHREPDMDQGAIGIAGQLWSTAEDLLSWGHALLGGVPDVLPAPVTTAMHTLQVMVEPAGWGQGWGLGLILDRRGDRILSGHTGAMPGFLAALSMDRRSEIVVSAFTNVTRGIRLNDLCAELTAEMLEFWPERQSPERPSAVRALPVQGGPLQDLPEELGGVLGRWWCESEETIFSWQQGCLQARLAEGGPTSSTTFDREGADRYRASSGRLCGESLQISRDEQGLVLELEWATYPYRRSPN